MDDRGHFRVRTAPLPLQGITFAADERVETEEDLRAWLSTPGNDERLRSLRGVGPKTVDYFRLLAGMSAVSIDRHLMSFLEMAGIEVVLYEKARDIVEEAASILSVPSEILDHSMRMGGVAEEIVGLPLESS